MPEVDVAGRGMTGLSPKSHDRMNGSATSRLESKTQECADCGQAVHGAKCRYLGAVSDEPQ